MQRAGAKRAGLLEIAVAGGIMIRIRLLQNIRYWGKAGRTYDVSDTRAVELLRIGLRKDEHDRYSVVRRAELVEDLGRHIGQSKCTYDKNGPSEAFGPPGPDKPTAMERVLLHNATLEKMVQQLNQGILIAECLLCGYKNNVDMYAMEEIGGRWWHKFCLKKTTWHQLKLIKAGKHDKVKRLEMFKKKKTARSSQRPMKTTCADAGGKSR